MEIRNKKFKLLLEGVEVPFDGFSMTAARNNPVSARITIKQNIYATGIYPRTVVHIFYNSSDDGGWRLAFAGNVIGCSPSIEGGRMEIAADGFLSLLDDLPVYYINVIEANSGAQLSQYTAKNARYLGLYTGGSIATVNDFATMKTWFLDQVMSKGISSALKSYINYLVAHNPFYIREQKSLKLDHLYKIYGNETYNKYISSEKFSEFILRAVEEIPQFTKLSTFIASLYWLIAYDYIDIPNPIYSEGKLMHRIYKPSLFFHTPPLCNLIFQNQYKITGFTKDFSKEVSRSIMTRQYRLLQQNVEGGAPNMLNFDIRMNYYPDLSNIVNSSTNGKDLTEIYRDEELYKGVVPGSYQLPFGDAFIRESDAGMNNIAEYNYFLQRYGNSTITISTAYAPDIVPGFPGAVFVDDGVIIGDVMYKTDVVSVSSDIIQSSIGFGNVRYYMFKNKSNYYSEANYDKVNDYEYPLYDKSVWGKTVIGKFYKEALGCGATTSQNNKDVVVSLKNIYYNYIKSGSSSRRYSYVKRLTHRDIATEGEVLQLVQGAGLIRGIRFYKDKHRKVEDKHKEYGWRYGGNYSAKSMTISKTSLPPFILERQQWVDAYLRDIAAHKSAYEIAG